MNGSLPGSYAGRAVAVTGAQGYIGASLVAALRDSGADVLRVGSRPSSDVPGTRGWHGDIADSANWTHIVAESDVIFHLAGNTSVYAANYDPAASLRSTVLPVALLTAAAQELGRCPRVVFASTATVYGLGDRNPASEATPPQPVSNYDLHKLFAEQQLQLASERGILDAASLRLSNVYGPSSATSSSADRGILNRIARGAFEGAPVRLYGGGDYLRDYVYIDDVVAAFVAAGAAPDAGGHVFNVATGWGTTVADAFQLVAQRVAAITGVTVAVESVDWPAAADRIEFRNFVADIAEIREKTGWEPKVSLQEGIDRLIADVRAKLVAGTEGKSA